MRYDAIIVGSGATGGWAAMELTARGLHVLVLECGPVRNLGTDVTAAVYAAAVPGGVAPDAKQPVQSRHPAFHEGNRHLFVDDLRFPYATPPERPFDWIRGNQVGGRTLTWGRIALRMSRYEIDETAHDGGGGAWPFTYDELAPYYAKVERFLGVHGHADGLPQLPDGDYGEGFPFTGAEQRFAAKVGQEWPERPVIAMRGIPVPESMASWPRFTAQGSTLEAAAKTGKLELRAGCAALEIMVDAREGLATGVRYADTATGEEHVVEGGLVLVCASTIGTLRLLLSSSGSHAPTGLGNDHDLLGRGLMDHVSFAVVGAAPEAPSANPPPLGGPHGMFVPRFRNLADKRTDYLGGFGYWGGIGRGFDGTRFVFISYGEVLPRRDNRVTLDRTRRDAFGLYLPHIDMTWGQNELAMVADARTCIHEMVDATGLKIVHERLGAEVPGRFVHETGGAPMGTDPKTSVLDPHNRLWSTPNVLVLDGASFSRCGYQNPTLTMLALSARACDKLGAALKDGTQRVSRGGATAA